MEPVTPAPPPGPTPISCVSCQAVTTNDGRTVWVCENCQTVNQPPLETIISAPPDPIPTVAPDALAAQAELNSAAEQVQTPPAPATPPPPPNTSPNPEPQV